MEKLLELIADYQSMVNKGVTELQKTYSTTEILKGWHQKKIPKSGILPSGIEFDFHGIGCILTIDGFDVNFDYGPNNRFDGFDLWRLSCFVNEKKNTYSEYFSNKNLLKCHFLELEDKGVIYQLESTSSSLYFLKNEDGY